MVIVSWCLVILKALQKGKIMPQQRSTLKEVMAEVTRNNLDGATDSAIREMVRDNSKEFKTSWVNLGRVLYTVWKDKLFKGWGYEKFENYITKEVGIRKQTAVKLLRSYFYLEREEPAYLKEGFSTERDASIVPGYEEVNVLRLAKDNKDLPKSDYVHLKKAVFENGKDALTVRKDLTQMMKQRKELDPDEEREKRSLAAVRRFVNAFRSFKRDMDALKLVPAHMLREAEEVIQKIERETL